MSKYKHKFVIYKDKNHQWRWRLRAKNGRIIADSGESYTRKSDLMVQLNKIISLKSEDVKVEVVDE